MLPHLIGVSSFKEQVLLDVSLLLHRQQISDCTLLHFLNLSNVFSLFTEARYRHIDIWLHLNDSIYDDFHYERDHEF